MRRSPQDVIYAISHALKEGKKGDEYFIADLAKRTGIHYVTMNNYITMIEYVQCNIPKFAKIEQKGNARIIISEELNMDMSDYERSLLRLFDKGAFAKSTAAVSDPFEGSILEGSIKNGDVLRIDSKIYLSVSGILKAADLADKREEKVLCSPIKTYSEMHIEDPDDA